MTECWRCGRATGWSPARSFVFGDVCDRADCRRVREGLEKRFKWFWFTVSLPADNADPGRGSVWSRDGEFKGCRGYAEPSLQTKIDADRMAEERRASA